MKKILLILVAISIITLIVILSSFIFLKGDEFTIPESIKASPDYELIKVNPDRISIASQPIIVDNLIFYYAGKKVGDKLTEDYYSFDINSKTTEEISKEEFNEKKSKEGVYEGAEIKREGSKLVYTNEKGKKVEINYIAGMRYGGNEDYFVWSYYKVGGIDEIKVLNVNDDSEKFIIPSEEFISTDLEFRGKPTFFVSGLGVYNSEIVVQNSKCIYSYDFDTLKEKMIVCDDNQMGKLVLSNDLIVFTGNSALVVNVDGRVESSIFLIKPK